MNWLSCYPDDMAHVLAIQSDCARCRELMRESGVLEMKMLVGFAGR